MAALTCEYTIKPAYRNLYNLDDEDSLNAFHGWVGKRISDELVKKYGYHGLDVIPQHQTWDDDLGLISDCDFQELRDGSLLVTFSREPYPAWGGEPGRDFKVNSDGSLVMYFQSV